MNWFFLSITAALCWAIGSVLVKKGFENISPLWNNVISNFLAIFVYIPAAFLLGESTHKLTLSTLPYIAIASLLYQVFYYAISKGQISLTGTVVASYPVITIILSHIFLHERLTPLQYMGILLIISGGILIAMPQKTDPGEKILHTKHAVWLLWAIFGAVSLGTGDFLAKVAVDRSGIFNYLTTIAIVANFYSVFNYLLDKPNRNFPKRVLSYFSITVSGLLLNLIGFVSFLYAFKIGKASLVAPISSVYPAITAAVAVQFLHERVTKLHIIGIGMTVSGLIAIGLS